MPTQGMLVNSMWPVLLARIILNSATWYGIATYNNSKQEGVSLI